MLLKRQSSKLYWNPIKIHGTIVTGAKLQFQVVDNAREAILGLDNLSKIESNVNSVIAPIRIKDDEPCIDFHIKQNTNISGKIYAARSIPFSLKPMVEIELKKLIAEGIITPEENPIMSAPIVPVLKKNEQVRICGDYRLTINSIIDVDQYHINTIDEINEAISGGKFYSRLDLKSAYLQLKLSDNARKFTTISTHMGHFSYTRLPFGVSSAAAIFQEFMDTHIVKDIPGVKAYQDDIIIAGHTKADHDQRLNAVQNRLSKYGL